MGQQHQQLYIYLALHSLHLRLWIFPLALALGNRHLLLSTEQKLHEWCFGVEDLDLL